MPIDVPDDKIEGIAFPPGIPFVYKFDKEMKPIKSEEDSLVQKFTSGVFLEKPGLLKEALKRQEDWRKFVPGADDEELEPYVKRMTSMEQSLLALKGEKQVEQLAATQSHQNGQQHKVHRNGVNATGDVPIILVKEPVEDETEEEDFGEFEESTHTARIEALEPVVPNVGIALGKDDPVVVFVRHGTTPHNQLALFTGWENPPLAEQGVDDAKRGGKLLKQHGFEFDVAYTSWLDRAIETAWYILDELDTQWIPLVKSWRLNERHYGALTGRSKKMVGNIYGQDQLKKWRRGFDIPPPKASSYSFSYPGNDYRRIKYVKDLRISLTETFCRSIEARELQIHRKFPKAESLKMWSVLFNQSNNLFCARAINLTPCVLVFSSVQYGPVHSFLH